MINEKNNHPNRGPKGPFKSPTPAEIRAARESAGMTQTEAANVIYSTLRAWQCWESDGVAARRMHPAFFELFILKIKA